MIESVNEIEIVGTISKITELKKMKSGKSCCFLSVGVKKEKEKGGTHTEYISVNVFGRTAENCHKFLSEGRDVYVLGSLKNQTFGEGESKQERVNVLAKRVLFL